jgi:hypothetical protein
VTVDLPQLANDLAAAFYMAILRPNPTLDATPDQASEAEYRADGAALLHRLDQPSQKVTIRCAAGSHVAHPDRRSVALVTVHDRHLVVNTIYRGRKTEGLRRSQVYLFHIPMLRAFGVRSISTFCFSCMCHHDMSLRWLEHARDNDISTHTRPLDDTPDTPPTSPVDQYGLAFANWIGHFPLRADQGQPIIATTYLFAASYYHYFGADPPHGAHLDRLTLRYNDRELMPGADRIRRPHPCPELLAAQLRIVNQAQQ